MSRKATTQQLVEQLQRLEMHNEFMREILTARDPSSPEALRAFTALRRKIDETVDARNDLFVLIAQLHNLVAQTDDIDVIRRRLEEAAQMVGLKQIDQYDPTHPEWFEVFGDDGELAVKQPAFIRVTSSGPQVIAAGIAHREPPAAVPDDDTAGAEPSDTADGAPGADTAVGEERNEEAPEGSDIPETDIEEETT